MILVPWLRHLLWHPGGWIWLRMQLGLHPAQSLGSGRAELISTTSCSAWPEVVDVGVMGPHSAPDRGTVSLCSFQRGNGEGMQVDLVADSLQTWAGSQLEGLEGPYSPGCGADICACVWQRMSCSVGTTQWTC